MRRILLTTMLLVSIPLHPQPAKAGKNTPNTPPPADASSVPRGTENLPLVVHPDSRPRSQAEANWEQEKAAIEASQKHVEVFLTVLVALTGLLQAIILGLQWWLLRRQTNHTVTSERAWFWCKADISWTQNTPNQIIGQVGFTYVNSGKTPGFITEVGFAMDVLEKGKSLPETPGDYASEDFRKWGGRGLLVVPTNTISRLGALAATQAVFAQIKDGTSVVWVHGFVKYRDTFVNRQRESRYCFRWNPSQGTGESSFSMEGPETYNSAT